MEKDNIFGKTAVLTLASLKMGSNTEKESGEVPRILNATSTKEIILEIKSSD